MMGPGTYAFPIRPQPGREAQEAGADYSARSDSGLTAKYIQLGKSVVAVVDRLLQKHTTAYRSGVGGGAQCMSTTAARCTAGAHLREVLQVGLDSEGQRLPILQEEPLGFVTLPLGVESARKLID